jgi:hypothetical protein
MLTKIFILVIGAFSAGLAAGNFFIAEDSDVGDATWPDAVLEQKFFLQTNPIKTINPATECRVFNESLSFEQNLVNCTRSNVVRVDI